jgi:signal transduction histidine kinase
VKGVLRRRPLWAAALIVCTLAVALAGLPIAGPWFVLPATASTVLVVLLVGWPLGGRALSPPLISAMSILSLMVTALHPGPLRDNTGAPWIALETVALSVLVAHVVRRAPRWTAAASGVLAGVAVAGLPLRVALLAPRYFSFQDDVAVSLSWAIWPAVAAAVGLYMRHLDRKRDVLVDNARREQRIALARDLHDFVAHDVGGLVLEAQAAQVAGHGYPEQALAAFSRIEGPA